MIQIQLVSYAQSRHLPRPASTFGLFSTVSPCAPSLAISGHLARRVVGERRAGRFSGEAARAGGARGGGRGGWKRDAKREWGAKRSVWKSAEGNVGDNLPLRQFRLRTAKHPFLSRILLPHSSFAPRSFPSSPAVRFVLHLAAYRTESLCIPMTTGWMHSKCKRMRDNAQVNVSRERDLSVCASSSDASTQL